MEGSVPYETGGHCLFYAVQEASMHFHNRGLTPKDRDEYKQEQSKRFRLYQALAEGEMGVGAWLLVDLQQVLSKLRENDVVPKTFFCTEKTKTTLETARYVRHSEAEFNILRGTGIVNLPAMVFIEGRATGDNHVWFCSGPESYDSDYDKHVAGGNVILAVSLKAKEG